jgi:UDP-N-acetylmuramoyl-tripeptide--D-alanyl-D-alanine ligase
MKKINPFIKWWVTPKLPYHDIFELPLLINKSKTAKYQHIFSQWIIHPIKRRLAKVYLNLLQRTTDIKVIGITGSAGKTTTKEMLFSILKTQGKTVCTRSHFDPVYNIPNTILATTLGTKYLILEMGVEFPGEMDFYLWLAKPDVGVITNIFPAHVEFLGDIEGILKEKGKLITGLSKDDTAVLNSGDEQLMKLSERVGANVIFFKPDANPFIQNANTAKVVAKLLKIKDQNIKKGLSEYKNPPHRLELINHPSGAVILDDSYNSNPWAAVSTLKYFNGLAKGKKMAVLGDMLELGGFEEEGHRLLGREVAKSGFSAVIGVGKSSALLLEEVRKESKSTETSLYTDPMKALPAVRSFLGKNTFILVKGSRSIGLDKIIEKLS